MKTVYVGQPFPHTFHKSLYLAGPTLRNAKASSWRPHALKLLECSHYDGVVFVPEFQDGKRSSDDDQHMDWELEAMRRSDIILFWAPAEQDILPAAATWVEFGLQVHSGRVIFGTPKEANGTCYMEKLVTQYHVASHHTLEDSVEAALTTLGSGANRSGAECLVPLEIWQAPHFRRWYAAQTSAGHALEDVQRIEWVFRVGPKRAWPLFIAVHVAIKVKGEDRVKSNEAVIIRPSVVTVCAYCPGDTRKQDRFILVKEYRTSAINAQGFVFELPGGSSFEPGVDEINVAIDELEQETGIRLARERFCILGRRQIASTMIANEALLLAARLEPVEMDAIATRQGARYGNRADTEQTYLYVLTRQQIVEGQLVDYAALGQISLVGED